MKWQEARRLSPNQFLLDSILDYHEEGDKKIVDEVALKRTIYEKDTNKEFLRAKEGTLVYHTSNEEFVIHIRRDPLPKV
ncbi:P-loop NTPase family protein [Bacillus cihuensis]|uniref:hypothetical protein n=1 Tax=Bacillus cihuensis TaxID=1208599 RepID=UPI000415217B|nr:hypothetical protein [Bacillus cihuensis]